MSTELDSIKTELTSLLDKLGIKDTTVEVETYNQGDTKTHVELRNYNKLMVEFFTSLPKEMLATEMDILRHKVENGGDFNDTFKIEDTGVNTGEDNSYNTVQSGEPESE